MKPEREAGMREQFEGDWHEWGCKCERCRNLIAAMLAVDTDGEYFFTDDEIQQFAELSVNPAPAKE